MIGQAIVEGGVVHTLGHGEQQDLFTVPGQADGQQLLDPFEITTPGLLLKLKVPTGIGLL